MNRALSRATNRITGAVTLGVVLVGVTAHKVQASPSGLITLPSTDIFENGIVHLDIDATYFSDVSQQDALGNLIKYREAIVTVGLTAGVGRGGNGLFGQTEVGVEYDVNSISGVFNDPEARASLNVKTQLYHDPRRGIRAVIGGTQLGDTSVFGNIVYATASKDFQKWGRVHVGGIRVTSPGIAGKRSSAQLAYENFITPKLRGLIEYNNDQTGYIGRNALGQTSVSLVYYLNQRSGIQFAVSRPNKQTSSFANDRDTIGNFNFYVGYDYNFNAREADSPGGTG